LQYEIRGEVSNFIEEFIVPNGKLADENIWKVICEKADNKNENVSVSHICNTLITCKKFFDENQHLNIVDFFYRKSYVRRFKNADCTIKRRYYECLGASLTALLLKVK
jgi:hypothetical protein